jgi:hypothetical protein
LPNALADRGVDTRLIQSEQSNKAIRLAGRLSLYPGPQRVENDGKVFWSVYQPLTENDGLVCRYHGRKTSSWR